MVMSPAKAYKTKQLHYKNIMDRTVSEYHIYYYQPGNGRLQQKPPNNAGVYFVIDTYIEHSVKMQKVYVLELITPTFVLVLNLQY